MVMWIKENIINKIVHILANRLLLTKIAEDQYMYDYGELKDELNYIYNHIEEKTYSKRYF